MNTRFPCLRPARVLQPPLGRRRCSTRPRLCGCAPSLGRWTPACSSPPPSRGREAAGRETTYALSREVQACLMSLQCLFNARLSTVTTKGCEFRCFPYQQGCGTGACSPNLESARSSRPCSFLPSSLFLFLLIMAKERLGTACTAEPLQCIHYCDQQLASAS